jgi:hypothetical protein
MHQARVGWWWWRAPAEPIGCGVQWVQLGHAHQDQGKEGTIEDGTGELLPQVGERGLRS